MAGSVIEDHPQRQMIIDALLAGEAGRSLASRTNPYVSPATLWRYRCKVLGPALQRVQSELIKSKALSALQSAETVPLNSAHLRRLRHEAEVQAVADPMLARFPKKQERRERWIQGAESKEDYRACAAIDRCETADIELEARMTGRLDSPGAGNVQIAIVIPDGATPPQVVVDVKPK